MKKLLFLILVVAGCTSQQTDIREKLSLAGVWKFKIDSLDQGLGKQWYNEEFTETVTLPGSMTENGKGYEVTVNTDWTGDIVDRSYFTDKKYEKYRQPGNIKIPFWLKPVKYYKGVAWYQKEIDVPGNWAGKRLVLSLERCHWESTVFVNGKASVPLNSLATRHEHDLTGFLIPGKNRISIRIDNRIIIPVGVNSHSISDHTQSNWNGIAGSICLYSTPKIYIDEIRVFPDVEKKTAKLVISIRNPEKMDFKGKLRLQAESFNTSKNAKLPRKNVTVNTKSGEQEIIIDYKIPRPELWNEFSPVLYKMSAELLENGKLIDRRETQFGMREFRTNGTRFEINGHPVFLRGTTECCIFPLTGYPPSDEDSWEKVLRTVKDYGLNHVRFHSFCPPEAAFRAADKLGIYFHIECSSWANQGTTIGDGGTIDKFIYDESDRILKEYGNHPSFCMLAYGNEPAGNRQNEFLGGLIKYWKSKDNRRVYTSGAGWPIIPENDYNLTAAPRIQGWGEGLKSIINARPPQTLFDYRDFVSKYNVPTVSHEIGQWCVYPDFKEIEKYTGVLKATNFEIFRESLSENNMADQAEEFLMASGKLQALCYKADIEAAFRTPGFAGFQILQLHDFPGQGTALVGILNPFFENKGYITPEEFRMFCNETVPLARMTKMTFSNNEIIKSDIEIAHFGPRPIYGAQIVCRLLNSSGETLYEQVFKKDTIRIDNCIPVGQLMFRPEGINEAQKVTLDVAIENTSFRNHWDLWIYPANPEVDAGKVLVTDRIDRNSLTTLHNGGSVLLMTYGKIRKDKGAQVAIGFSSIFWNTAWTNNQPPHTLGILCDPTNQIFNDFPTEFHSNWQWWDPVSNSQVMILDGFPSDLHPLLQPIDTWFENRRLSLAFESRTGGGKLLVCSIDLKNLPEERIVSKQLLASLLKYMNSEKFDPVVEIAPEQINNLFYN